MRVLKIEPDKAPIVINVANELSVLQGLVVGVRGEDFCDLGDADLTWFRNWLPHLRWGDGR